MFALEIIWAVLLFAMVVLAFGAALAPRNDSDPLLRLAIGIVLALTLEFSVGFAGYAAGIANRPVAFALGVVLAGTLWWRRAALREIIKQAAVRQFLAAWLVLAAWAIGVLALVVTYSGGKWAVDWVEHWQRTLFFVEHQPLTTQFAVIYPLTARPPLMNLLTALWLEGTRHSFAQYQLFMTLGGTLVLLPLRILVRRWSTAPISGALLLLLLMLSPVVVQNLTFTWTKLPVAFFILVGLCCTLASASGPRLTGYAGLCFGAALLTHYSAGPWIIAVWAAVAAWGWKDGAFWRSTLFFGATITLVVALWLGWAFAHFGWRGTSAANSTAAGWAGQTAIQRASGFAGNVFDTLVPFPLRGEPPDRTIVQTSRLGRLRDVAFNLYQVNLPLGLGLAGLYVLAIAATSRTGPTSALPGERRFFWILIPVVTLLGIAAHTPRDPWGLAHICLQPLLLGGLAYVAVALPGLPRRSVIMWAGLAAVDFLLGVALQLGIESWMLAPVIAPRGGPQEYLHALGRSAYPNANDKWAFHFEYVSDRLGCPAWLIALALAALAAAVIFRVNSTRRSA